MRNWRGAALLVALLSRPAFPGGTGGEAMPFLKIDAGARAAALGGSYCASGDDALSVFYNPAGSSMAMRKEAAFSHSEWLQGIRHEVLAYVQPLSRTATVFSGANLLLSGEMDQLNAAGVRTGTFDSRDAVFLSGISGSLGRGIYGGAAVKALYQKADAESAYSWAGDLGLLMLHGKYRYGLSAANIGGKLELGSTSFDVPLILRAGAARLIREQFWVMADVVKNGAGDATLGTGAEAEFELNREESFFIRAGYRNGRSANAGSGFSCGGGLHNKDLRLDYAFSPYGDLGTTHRFTLSFTFGKKRSEFPLKAYSSDYMVPDKDVPLSKRKEKAEEKRKNTLREFSW